MIIILTCPVCPSQVSPIDPSRPHSQAVKENHHITIFLNTKETLLTFAFRIIIKAWSAFSAEGSSEIKFARTLERTKINFY